jgi:hypothetical protein
MPGSVKNVLPPPSVEWCDKKMGSSYHTFASNTSFSLYGLAVNTLQLDVVFLRAYLHDGRPLFYVHVCVCRVMERT